MPLRAAPLTSIQESCFPCLPSSTSSSASARARSSASSRHLAAVNAIEDDFVAMSDAELQGMTDEFKERWPRARTSTT